MPKRQANSIARRLASVPSDHMASEVAIAIRERRLVGHLRAEVDRIDTEALGAALQASLDSEIDLFDYGLQRAGGSAAKAELVARKVEILSSINNARIRRRFGS